MSATIDSNRGVQRGALGQSSFVHSAVGDDGEEDSRDLTSGIPGTLYLPGSNLNGSNFFSTLEGFDDEMRFERASKMPKIDPSGPFSCGPTLGDQLGPRDAGFDTSMTGVNNNSTLLMKLLSSTDVEGHHAPEEPGPSHAIYSALLNLATSGGNRSTPGASTTSKGSAANINNRERSAQGHHTGPALILGPELFSAGLPQSMGLTTLAAAVTTPTVGRKVRRVQRNYGTGKFAGAHNFPNDDVNGPVRVVRRVHGWVTILRHGGRQATGPYRETVHQCVEDQKEVHRLRLERGLTNSELMQLLEQMKVVTDRHPSTQLIKKPRKLDYTAPIGVRRMHKGFRASVRVRGKEVYGPLRQDVADATCDREEMMKYRHVVDAPGMRAFVKTLKERVYPHHQQEVHRSLHGEQAPPSNTHSNTHRVMPTFATEAQGPILSIG
ncbi:hypothetical protein Pmar_PMAR019995 [Perkinsus marinus ATCC 50983]|uniref:Uncharacterized protein n=1 Tax=Perkinsus marinus (strain ATCC 50983 / TXsc) TaxID=423536 RepID=C5LJA1_PERM5|nr:hypothetical protein Pmar_PMAR019995 [Perkinsus marinus ATCC 50983]EER03217.1 hypothetical protein Pmar_PMAR019995 [Perkinsus marinus ATCC 50983]|eukprot:XP_002771401.1 hypothetical protein Pmar_PMAR019995 [Perkinsus marinus ATCC 50983]